MDNRLRRTPDDEPLPEPNDDGFEENGDEVFTEIAAPQAERTVPLNVANLTGQQIGRYRIEQQIGSGGVATVYQAYDQVQGIPVALKVLMPHADAKTYSRFRREALTAGGLHYEHIVRILQVGTLGAGGLAYIAMELVDGESLSELLHTRGLLQPQESCNLLEPIARALDHAHRAGIVHRDVKPSNILLRTVSPGAPGSVQLESLDHPVVPLLSDFGVARYLDAPELTSTGRTVGTPAYMAPEQCAGKRDVDGRADIYSLGCVLYRCVTGRIPFSGSVTQILHAHVYEPLSIDTDSLQRLSPALVDILRRSLAKEPGARFASADEMAQALAFAAGRNRTRRLTAESESTATLTLSTPSTMSGRTPATSTTVLVPGLAPTASQTTARSVTNPLTTRTVRTVQALPAANVGVAAPAREERFYRLIWTLLPLALALLVFAFVVALIGSPFGLRRESEPPTASVPGVVILPSPTNTPTVEAATFTPTPSTADAIPVTPAPAGTPAQPGVILPTSTGTATPPAPIATETPTLPEPTATWTFTPLETPTPTVAPTATETVTPTMTDTPAPTETPTATPTPVPEVRCDYAPDPIWSAFITGLDPDRQQELICAFMPSLAVHGELQPFAFGFMLRLDNSSNEVYVFYNGDNRWEKVTASWEEGEPLTPEGPPPGPEFFLPTRIFGKVWQEERVQAALGFATTSEPQSFPGRVQTFPGGTLVYNFSDGRVFAFFEDRRL